MWAQSAAGAGEGGEAMSAPRLLDAFSGAGGAARGYQMAGFHVTGVDIKPQPRYAGDAFVQGDALEYIATHGREFDAIHASPPCQSYSRALRHMATPQPMLIEPVRARLQASGRAWVIENVAGAVMPTAIILCGTAFGLRVYRHRYFETSFPLFSPGCAHARRAMNPHRAEGRELIYAEFGRQDPEKIWGNAMGVPWMNRHETREAIPPVFTAYVGKYLMAVVRPELVTA